LLQNNHVFLSGTYENRDSTLVFYCTSLLRSATLKMKPHLVLTFDL
jgi:hypothetical protein